MSDQEIAICKYATEMSIQTLAYNYAKELDLDIFVRGGRFSDHFWKTVATTMFVR